MKRVLHIAIPHKKQFVKLYNKALRRLGIIEWQDNVNLIMKMRMETVMA
jgi:hypothetical protein